MVVGTLSIVMMMAFIAGAITIIVSTIGLISDKKKSRAAKLEHRRQHISENMVRTVMGYKEQQVQENGRYVRRA